MPYLDFEKEPIKCPVNFSGAGHKLDPFEASPGEHLIYFNEDGTVLRESKKEDNNAVQKL